MTKVITVLLFLLIFNVGYAGENQKQLNISCEDFRWSDIEMLVQAHLDETLYTALVMQAQSANYNVSTAASQAMDDTLPDVIKTILRALIKADC